MTPAALGALLRGDTENFIAASTPGGIEAQERRGQLEQATKQTLPIDLRAKKSEFEALGFVFGKELDTLFQEATFPSGWSKQPTEHSMWSDILDNKGWKRGMIFYKAAFYDKSAHAYLTHRFNVDDDYKRPICTATLIDTCGVVSYSAQAPYEEYGKARGLVNQWLDENHPDWKSPLAYWP